MRALVLAALLVSGCSTYQLQMRALGPFEWKTMSEYRTEAGCNRVLLYASRDHSPIYIDGKPYTIVSRCVKKAE